MGKHKPNRTQTNNGGHDSAVRSELLPEANEVKTVLGQRLRPETETFVLVDPPASTGKTSEPLEPEVLLQCYFCSDEAPTREWEENQECCPSCDRPRTAPNTRDDDDASDLSEGELVLQSIGVDARGGGDDIKVRIDHLPDYEQDGRADSRAKTKFCIYIQPLRFDYLDEVQKRCTHLQPGEEGRFLFRAFKLSGDDRGLMKIWDEGVTGIDRAMLQSAKPDAAQPCPAPAQQSISQPDNDPLRKTLERLIVKRMERALEILETSPGQQQLSNAPAQSTRPPSEEDEDSLAAKLLFKNPHVVDRLAKRFGEALGAEPDHWVVGLVKEAFKYAPQIMSTVQALRAAPNGGNGSTVSAGPPAPQLPAEISQLLSALVDELIQANDVEAAAQFTAGFLKTNEQYAPLVANLLKKSPTEILLSLAHLDPANALLLKLSHSGVWVSEYRDRLFELLEEGGSIEPPPDSHAAAPQAPAGGEASARASAELPMQEKAQVGQQ